MDPMIGQGIVIAVLAVIVFACGRSAILEILAELRGERSCAGCTGCQSGKSCEECRMCARLEELRKQKNKEEMHAESHA